MSGTNITNRTINGSNATPSPFGPAPSPFEPSPFEPSPFEPAPSPFEPSPFEPAPSPFEPSPFEPAPSPFEPSPFEPSRFEPSPFEPAPFVPSPFEPAPSPFETSASTAVDNGTVPLIMAVIFVAVIALVAVWRARLEKFWSSYNLSRYHMVDIDGVVVDEDDIELVKNGGKSEDTF